MGSALSQFRSSVLRDLEAAAAECPSLRLGSRQRVHRQFLELRPRHRPNLSRKAWSLVLCSAGLVTPISLGVGLEEPPEECNTVL
jgi:hypothetical protein